MLSEKLTPDDNITAFQVRSTSILLKGVSGPSSFLELDQTCKLRVSTIPLVSAIVSACGVGS